MGEDQKRIFDYTPKYILSLFYLDSRYNLHNLPYKIKKNYYPKIPFINERQKKLISLKNLMAI